MKTKNVFRVLSVLLAIMMLITAAPVRVEAKGAHLNKTKITITEGDTVKLKVSGASGKIKWSTSKKSVATVSQKGVVKAKNEGTAIIKAKFKDKILKCKVIVEADVDDWDEEDDDVVSNSSPLDKVKAYIKRYGAKNDYGDCGISTDVGDYTYYILCDKDTGALSLNTRFFGFVGDNLTLISMNVEFNEDMTGTASITESVTAIGIGSYDTTGKFTVSAFSSGKDASFSVKEKTDEMQSLSNSEIIELSQSNLDVTILGCERLLSTETGYSLKDIGLSNYRF